MRISVAMCTFNGGRFLSEQLQSIKAQTRVPDELVICDDGSTDESVEIIKQFSRQVTFPVLLEINEHNYGPTKNFEKAIRLCKGQIIALADQDDIWYSRKLSFIADIFIKNEHTGAVFSDAELIDHDSRPLGKKLWDSFLFNSREQEKFARGEGLKVLLKHATVTGATMAFRSNFNELTLPIPANQIHDHWIALLIASISQLAPIKTPLIRYRQHQGKQIGPGDFGSFLQMVNGARLPGRDHYLDEAERFREVCNRLRSATETFPPNVCALHLIRQKIRHRTTRGSLPSSRFLRFPFLIREVATLRYWRYSNGLGSVAKDFLV